MMKQQTLHTISLTAQIFYDRGKQYEASKEKLSAALIKYGFTLENLRGTWTTYRRGELTNVERSMFWDAMFVSLSSVKIKGKRLSEVEVREIMSHFEAASRDNRKMYNGTPMGTIKNEVTWMGQATSFYTKSIKKLVTEPNDKNNMRNPALTQHANIINKFDQLCRMIKKLDPSNKSNDINAIIMALEEQKNKFL